MATKKKLESKVNNNVYKMVTIAMLTAIAEVLYMLDFPIFSGPFVFLKFDFSDIAALIGGITFGPMAGVIIEFLKNLIHVFIKGLGSTMGFGDLMNFLVGSAYIVPFVLCYHEFSKKIKKSVAILISAVIGCFTLIGIGAAANYFIAPLYFKYFVSQIITNDFLIGYLSYACIINVLKGVTLSIVAYPIILILVDKLKKVAKL
ncbi:MAG: ECF transporter S component [Ruminococcaceae bacterium]|nr:ECF transporter S component [Oscillospiraceae bacterium]